MQVNRVQTNNYNNQPNFGTLRITEQGLKALHKAFKPEQFEQINKWGKELDSTKHFDLEIGAILDDLNYSFRHKTDEKLSSDAPLRPIYNAYNKISASGTDLIDAGDTFTYNNLRFSTDADATKAYKILAEHAKTCKPYNRNDIKTLHWAVDATKILEKATEHTGSDSIRIVQRTIPFKTTIIEPAKPTQKTENINHIKQFFINQLKKAWNILIGD